MFKINWVNRIINKKCIDRIEENKVVEDRTLRHGTFVCIAEEYFRKWGKERKGEDLV